MEGQVLTTIFGKTFFCEGVVKKDGKTYYKDGYILWEASKIKDLPKKTIKQSDDKPKKIHNKSNRTGNLHRNAN